MMKPSVPLDPSSFKGLAHPLRVAILAVLRTEGPATASQLADVLDTSSGATSYHLRQLFRHGFVAERTDIGKGRERYWEASQPYTYIDRAELAGDSEALALYDEFMRAASFAREAEVAEWVASEERWGPEWSASVALNDYFLTATANELADLSERISEMIFELTDRPEGEVPPDAVSIRAHVLAFPVGSHRTSIRNIAGHLKDEEE